MEAWVWSGGVEARPVVDTDGVHHLNRAPLAVYPSLSQTGVTATGDSRSTRADFPAEEKGYAVLGLTDPGLPDLPSHTFQ